MIEQPVLDPGHRAMTTAANRLTSDATSSASEYGMPMAPSLPLRAFIDALARLGFDVRKLLASVGLTPGDLDDPDATVPSTVVSRVLCAAVGERRYPDLGARLAAVTPIGAFPLLDYLVLTTDTVGGALDQLVRYFHLV